MAKYLIKAAWSLPRLFGAAESARIVKQLKNYIMYTLPKMYIGSFRDVRIPSNTELYAQFGMKNSSRPGSVDKTGDFTEPVNQVGNKLADLSRGSDEFNNMYEAYKASEEAKSKPAETDASESSGDNAE